MNNRRRGSSQRRDGADAKKSYERAGSSRPAEYKKNDRKQYSEDDKPRTRRDDSDRDERRERPSSENRGSRKSFSRRDDRPQRDGGEYRGKSEGGYKKPFRGRSDEEGDNRGYRKDKPRFDRSENRSNDGDRRPFKKDGARKDWGKDNRRDDRRDDRKPQGRYDDRKPSRGGYKPNYKKSTVETTNETDEIRLNKYIASAGVCSRREADKLISDGLIAVNDEVVTEMGYKVTMKDTVKYGGEVIRPERNVYVLLNKPKNTITTTSDEKGRRTVMSLVNVAADERIYPVGRLDRDTTGVLLLTNDGDLAKKLTHPKYNVSKIYKVTLDKNFTEDHLKKLDKGVTLEDGFIKPDKLSFIIGEGKNVVGVEIHSGRNRIVRRMFESLGYQVDKLDRVVFGGLTKKNLPRGKWRHLTPKELEFLAMI